MNASGQEPVALYVDPASKPPRVQLVVLWGIPGTGKSTFARWLRDQKEFVYLDNDLMALKGPDGPLELAWVAVTSGQAPAHSFVAAVGESGQPVVAEYGMYVSPNAIELLRRLRDLGASTLAKQAWRSENKRAQRQFEDGRWDEVVGVIDGSWALVTDFFGTDILRTVEAGPVHIQPERIFEAWLGGKPST